MCCKLRYRVRWFSSKGAVLVIIWNILLNVTSGSLDNIYQNVRSDVKKPDAAFPDIVSLVPYATWLFMAPLSGWLADAWFGNYRMVKVGIVFLFISSVLECLIYLLVPLPISNSSLTVAAVVIVNSLGYAGQATILVTLLQLGLDQMPDASSSNITSFISWFIFSIQCGFWICDVTSIVPMACINHEDTNGRYAYIMVWSLVPVICSGLVLCSDFFLSSKWLTIEPKSPQSLRAIRSVLKFAAKHKAPVNRSALTYWEEDIPSRIDLGKSKYGGPFTTEQVENVKTILRLFVVSVALWVVVTAAYLWQESPVAQDSPSNESCISTLLEHFTSNVSWWVVSGIVVYEFAIYPFITHLMPSMLKRIGAASFIVLIVNITYLVLCIVKFEKDIPLSWIGYPHSVIAALLKILLTAASLEFLCAQSPYNMRGLLIGYFWCINLLSYVVVNIVYSVLTIPCNEQYCVVIYSSLATGLSVIGFVVYCILARWYKRRVRDDISTPHRWVEEVYDRYLKM